MTAYAIVTPARDEAENLRRLAACVAAQTAQPAEWMIVDDGSIDGTLELARELERRHDWVRVVARPRGAPLADGRRDGRPLLAFEAGAAALRTRPEVVVKLDADVSMPPVHLAAIVAAFAADPQLGIASGVRFERERGAWRRQYVTGTSVESPIRAYRRRCLEEIAPIEARFYWDGIDEVKARLRGWRTAILEDAGFRHHRAMGARDSGRARAWALEGRGSHYMGYRPSYLFIRSLFQARRDPAALAMLWGYAAAAAGPDRRYPDPGVRAYVRRQQSLRRLPMRAREALGRSRPRPGRRTWRSPA